MNHRARYWAAAVAMFAALVTCASTLEFSSCPHLGECLQLQALPQIINLAPDTALSGGPVVIAAATGRNFTPFSVARLNDIDLPTEFVDSETLRAWIAPALLASAGSRNFTVFNPEPDGGISNPVDFTVQENPPPTLTSLSPAAIPRKSADFRLKISGNNFVHTSQVLWSGEPRFTYYLNPTEIQAYIPAEDLTDMGIVQIKVRSPEPGGGETDPLDFTISGRATPTIIRLDPAWIILDQPPNPLRIIGNGYDDDTLVTVDGYPCTPVLENPGTLWIDLPSFNSITSVFNKPIHAMVEQPDGKWIISGEFNVVNGTFAPRIIRLYPDGGIDPGFSTPVLNGIITALALQPDGKILVGGSFIHFDGKNWYYHIVRLNPNGSLDAGFVPPVEMYVLNDPAVWQIIVQPDGRILVGGKIRSHIWALTPNGSKDPAFNQLLNGPVHALHLQPDGQILVGGEFTQVGETSRNRIARLDADGQLDTTFDPGSAADDTVRSIQSSLPNGNVLIGGDFTQVNGESRVGIALLTDAGSVVEDQFIEGTGSGESVLSLWLQADGRVLAGGRFTTIGGGGINNLARLNENGSLDGTFNPGIGADGQVNAVLEDSRGRILAGGQFQNLNGEPRQRLAHLDGSGSFHIPYGNGFVPVTVINPDVSGSATARLPVVPMNAIRRLFLPVLIRSSSSSPGGWVSLLSENFEGRFPQDHNWQVFHGAYTPGTWAVGDCNPHGDRMGAWAAGSDADCGQSPPASLDARMITGPYDLSGCIQAELRWWNLVNLRPGEDSIKILVSETGKDFASIELDPPENLFNRWHETILNLDSYCGKPHLWIGFRLTISRKPETRPTGWMVDDIQIRKYVP